MKREAQKQRQTDVYTSQKKKKQSCLNVVLISPSYITSQENTNYTNDQFTKEKARQCKVLSLPSLFSDDDAAGANTFQATACS